MERAINKIAPLISTPILQVFLQVQPGVRLLVCRDLLRRAFSDQIAVPITALRPQIDQPVRHFDDVRVMLDDDDAVALIDEPVQHLDQLPEIASLFALLEETHQGN
jgi:hypothetical protein